MKYRYLGNTGLQVSETDMGCEGFAEDGCRNTKQLFDEAQKCGINYFDLYASNPQVRSSVGPCRGMYGAVQHENLTAYPRHSCIQGDAGIRGFFVAANPLTIL